MQQPVNAKYTFDLPKERIRIRNRIGHQKCRARVKAGTQKLTSKKTPKSKPAIPIEQPLPAFTLKKWQMQFSGRGASLTLFSPNKDTDAMPASDDLLAPEFTG